MTVNLTMTHEEVEQMRKEIAGAMVVDPTLNEIVTEQVLSLPYKALG
jgi:hypothetical protein